MELTQANGSSITYSNRQTYEVTKCIHIGLVTRRGSRGIVVGETTFPFYHLSRAYQKICCEKVYQIAGNRTSCASW